MTSIEFATMKAAAREVLNLYHAGVKMTDQLVTWARGCELSMRASHSAPRPDSLRMQVMQVMEQHPVEGYLCRQVADACGHARPQRCMQALHDLAHRGHIVMLKVPMRTRYFLNEVALKQGRPLVEAEERRRMDAAIAKERPRKKKLKAPPAPKPRAASPSAPREPSELTKRAIQSVFKPKTKAKPPPSGSVFIPAHVKVQVCPSFEDRRPKSAPVVGGFVAEWKKLTGGNP